eukprot:10498300-Alexandrium_andersonii.AAC.1
MGRLWGTGLLWLSRARQCTASALRRRSPRRWGAPTKRPATEHMMSLWNRNFSRIGMLPAS